ncbi:SCO1860 family LAETG-anchored protein [Streptomyces albipurpureus]|uniref:LPXTG cell wall anchor domain-containing protein n=1 Tax=Streptomyces albipurpureus TaxID=2897419 RepID=A0ABT0UTF0_9ACTN|nr:SCO1860 family LAETG-anchored protein [Streptomyces sp. CWNU-1]MCM2391521.1 LPXTG cell wall anchor domain-containing protein [Streptomyces sp. CWNU-1]
MNSNAFRMSARRCAAATATAALVAAPVAFAAPAQATGGGEGRASAVVLRTGLEVSLLNKTVQVPLNASLNEVKAPASAEQTALTVELDGVDRGKPFSVLRADVATAKATTEKKRTEGYANLVRAKVNLPGLPLLSLIEVEQVTSRAVCKAGERPTAESNLLGHVRVLGKKVTLTTGGQTKVTVPGVGEVTLDLSRTHTTSRTAAATALALQVAVNPLNLNVAEVNGSVTLVEATCESPKAPHKQEQTQATEEPQKQQEQPAKQEPTAASTGGVKALTGAEPAENLAETGGSPTTMYLAAGSAALLGLGGGALLVARKRARTRG